MWEMDSGKCLYTLVIEDITLAENGPVEAGVTSVVLSPDGKFLAAGSLDTVVRIWDAKTGILLDKLKGHKDSVYSVAFSPEGNFLVSGSLDKTLKIWDMATLRAGAEGASSGEVGEGGRTSCVTTLLGHKVSFSFSFFFSFRIPSDQKLMNDVQRTMFYRLIFLPMELGSSRVPKIGEFNSGIPQTGKHNSCYKATKIQVKPPSPSPSPLSFLPSQGVRNDG